MKRSVLDYLENTAKRCPERLAWDASAPFTFGQWWDAEGILRRVGGGVLLCAA